MYGGVPATPRRAALPSVGRQAEVDQPRHAVVAQDDVRRLDVAVHQAAGVDRGQPLGHLLDQPRKRRGSARSPP